MIYRQRFGARLLIDEVVRSRDQDVRIIGVHRDRRLVLMVLRGVPGRAPHRDETYRLGIRSRSGEQQRTEHRGDTEHQALHGTSQGLPSITPSVP